MRRFILCAVVLLSGVGQTDAATVVSDTNIELSYSDYEDPEDPLGGDYMLTVDQSLPGDYTSVWFDYDGVNMEIVTWNVDEESDWYLVEYGDEFCNQTISEGAFTTIFETDSPKGSIRVGSGDFYLAVATSQSLDYRDVFGWTHLQNTDTGLVQLGNAVVYGGEGIVVGTTTVVPEPTTFIMSLIFGAISICVTRWRRRK